MYIEGVLEKHTPGESNVSDSQYTHETLELARSRFYAARTEYEALASGDRAGRRAARAALLAAQKKFRFIKTQVLTQDAFNDILNKP